MSASITRCALRSSARARASSQLSTGTAFSEPVFPPTQSTALRSTHSPSAGPSAARRSALVTSTRTLQSRRM